MIEETKKFVLKTFEPVINFLKETFPEMESILRKIQAKKTVDEIFAESILVFFLSFIFLTILINMLLSLITLNPIFSLFSTLILSSFFSFLLVLFYLNYPKIILKSLANKIDKELHFSFPVFSTFVSEKVPLHLSIKQFCSSNPNLKLSKELDDIYKLVEFGGLDIISAINRKILVCPSEKLTNILTGLASVLKTGANIKEYANYRAKEIINEYRNRIRESGRKIGLFFQIYIISLVIGTLLFIILTSIMSAITPIPNLLEIQFIIVFIFVPIISIVMSILVKSFLP